MKKLIILIFLLVQVFVSIAQRRPPGYMGKRFLLKYDQGISWSLGRYARGIPNFIYNLQGDLAISKKFSFGAEYSFMARKYNTYVGRVDEDYYSFNYGYYRLDRAQTHRVGFYAKLFSQNNGHIAPAGPYLFLGFNFYFIKAKYSISDDDEFHGNNFTPDQNLSFDLGPSIGGGKQYIVGNRLVISLDVRFTLPILGFGRAFGHEVQMDTNGGESDAKLRTITLNRWTSWSNAQANFITFRMGIGTLL